MRLSARGWIGVGCLVVATALIIVSFTVRNDVIRWYAKSALLLHIVGAVLLRQGVRRGDDSARGDISAAQKKYLLILLRRSSASLNAPTLEAAAHSAWHDRFGPNSDGSPFVQSGEEKFGFVLQAHGNAFMVIETPKGVRELQPPLRFYPDSAESIWADYVYELSIGLAYDYDTDTNRLSAFVGSLAAALADRETLGVFHPTTGQLWQLNQETLERLRVSPETFVGAEENHAR